MIISVDEVISLPEFQGMDKVMIQKKLDALEVLIRKYTNNNFQNKNIRFLASSMTDRINGVHPFIRVGDTIQISESLVNDGLYVVTEISDEYILIDKEIFAVPTNLVTKVEYPMDVQQGIINLMKWEQSKRDKVGIKSETLSRHSVTYYDQDANNQVMGYPVSLLGFLDSYMKARC
jgi:hypothetical protein